MDTSRPHPASAACLAFAALWGAGCGLASPSDLYIGAPNTTETHALVTVQAGAAAGREVWRLVSRAQLSDGAEHKAFLPDPAPQAPIEMPTQYTVVAKGGSGVLRVTVDALDRDGVVVARGRGSVELAPHAGVPLPITLERACDVAADCSDGLRCNGEEQCVEGVCVAGTNPCATSVTCLDSVCVEGMPGCVITTHPERCPGASYCDPIRDCAPGVPCDVDRDCAGLGDLCNPKVCQGAHCVDGTPVNPNDNNPCTVDVCQPEMGPTHYNLAVGNVCSAETEATRRVCRRFVDGGPLSCVESQCGDGFVDSSNGEQCDLGGNDGGNDDEACTRGLPDAGVPGCRLPRCGDGVVSTSLLEECDDGNTNTTDDCVGCRTARCGDGYHHLTGTPPFEQCDEGTQNNLGACGSTCRLTSFDVLQIMGAGADCPATSPDGGFVLPNADGGWDYQDAGAFLVTPDGDARCQPLQGLQQMALRSVTFDGLSVVTDELMVADGTGLRVVNLRTLQTQQMFAMETNAPLQACVRDANQQAWVRFPSQGLPGAAEGLDGLMVVNNEINYRTAATHRIFRALLPHPPGAFSNIQFFSFIGTSMYSVADCCDAVLDRVWRPSMCTSCPQVVFDAVPQVFFDFAGKLFLVLTDTATRRIHATNGADSCGTSVVSFATCGAEDAGPPPDGGSLGPWLHAASVPTECLEGSSVALLLSGPGMHRIHRAGMNVPGDLNTRCMSSFRPIAGVEGQPGNSPQGTRANQALIDTPTGAGQDATCTIYFADTGNHLVRQITLDGVIHNAADIPGLKTLAVHPTLGVVAATDNKLFLVRPRVDAP